MDGSFAALTSSLAEELQNVKSPEQLDDGARLRLSGMLEQVSQRIEPPMKFLQSLTQGSTGLVATRVAIAMGIFDAFAANGHAEMTLEELDSKTKGDATLLSEQINAFVERPGQCKGKIGPHGANQQEQMETYADWIINGLGCNTCDDGDTLHDSYDHLRSHGNLLEFLQETDFQNPNDFFNGPWQFGQRTKQNYFEWMADDKLRGDSFNTVMKINQQFRGQDWFDFYPVEEKLQTSSDNAVLVDIGGGLGHDAFAFRKRFPNLPGRVVLEDLPQVISQIQEQLPQGLETLAHDAFTPQVITGAKAYYLRTVLHDFPNTQALQILGNVRQAMDKSSVLLINENLMPEEEISAIAIDVDFVMMNSMASLERTEKQWLQLIDDAGFDLVKIWRPTQQQRSPNALFEAVPKQ